MARYGRSQPHRPIRWGKARVTYGFTISVTVTTTSSLLKQVGHFIAATVNSVVSDSKGDLHTINASVITTVTYIRGIGKVISFTQATSASVIKAISKYLTISGGGGSSTQTFGYTTIGGTPSFVGSGGVNFLDISGPFASGGAGTLSKITAYMQGQGGAASGEDVRAVIYRDSAGQPGALVTVSQELALTNQTAAWYDFTVSPITITNDNYWIGFWFGPLISNGSMNVFFDTQTNAERFNNPTAYSSSGNPVDPWQTSGTGTSNSKYSIYATYNANINPIITLVSNRIKFQVLTVIQSSVASLVKSVGKFTGATDGTQVTDGRGMTFIINASTITVSTLSKMVGKIRSATVTTTASLIKSAGKILGATEATSVTDSKGSTFIINASVITNSPIIKSALKGLKATVTTTVSLSSFKIRLLTILVTVTTNASVIKGVLKNLIFTQSSITSLLKTVGKIFSIISGTTVTRSRFIGKILTVVTPTISSIRNFCSKAAFVIGEVANITFTKTILRSYLIVVTTTVSLLKTTLKNKTIVTVTTALSSRFPLKQFVVSTPIQFVITKFDTLSPLNIIQIGSGIVQKMVNPSPFIVTVNNITILLAAVLTHTFLQILDVVQSTTTSVGRYILLTRFAHQQTNIQPLTFNLSSFMPVVLKIKGLIFRPTGLIIDEISRIKVRGRERNYPIDPPN